MCSTIIHHSSGHSGNISSAYRVLLVSLLCLQVQGSDVVLDVAIEHGLPELHGGPHHVLLHAAVGELSDACAQFLSDENTGKDFKWHVRTSVNCKTRRGKLK